MLERARAHLTSPDRSRRRVGKRPTRQLQHDLAEAEQRQVMAAAIRERA